MFINSYQSIKYLDAFSYPIRTVFNPSRSRIKRIALVAAAIIGLYAAPIVTGILMTITFSAFLVGTAGKFFSKNEVHRLDLYQIIPTLFKKASNTDKLELFDTALRSGNHDLMVRIMKDFASSEFLTLFFDRYLPQHENAAKMLFETTKLIKDAGISHLLEGTLDVESTDPEEIRIRAFLAHGLQLAFPHVHLGNMLDELPLETTLYIEFEQQDPSAYAMCLSNEIKNLPYQTPFSVEIQSLLNRWSEYFSDRNVGLNSLLNASLELKKRELPDRDLKFNLAMRSYFRSAYPQILELNASMKENSLSVTGVIDKRDPF